MQEVASAAQSLSGCKLDLSSRLRWVYDCFALLKEHGQLEHTNPYGSGYSTIKCHMVLYRCGYKVYWDFKQLSSSEMPNKSCIECYALFYKRSREEHCITLKRTGKDDGFMALLVLSRPLHSDSGQNIYKHTSWDNDLGTVYSKVPLRGCLRHMYTLENYKTFSLH